MKHPFKRLTTNNLALCILLIVILLSYLHPLFTNRFYRSHDGEGITARFGAYVKAFQDGHIPPRWAGDLNFRYGTPVLNFFYPLPGYVASFLYVLGFTLEQAYKTIGGISFILSGIGFYLWMKGKYKPLLAFTAALFYALAPYHFLNLYVRGEVAELLGLSLLPFVFLSWDTYLVQKTWASLLICSTTYALLILSHNGVALTATPLFIGYAIVTIVPSIKTHTMKLLRVVLLALGLSCYFWLPAITEAKFTHQPLMMGNIYKENFPSPLQLISTKWGFGDQLSAPTGLSPQLGILHMILAIVTLFFTKKTLEMRYWSFALIVSIFFTLSASEILWRTFPLLAKLQFPWRISGISSFIASVLAMHSLTQFPYRIVWILLLVLLLTSTMYAKINQPISHSDDYYFNFPGSTYFQGEATPIWTAGDPSKYPLVPAFTPELQSQLTSIKRSTTTHIYQVTVPKQTIFVDNTLYFPGWKAYVDDIKASIEFQNHLYRGLVTFSIPQGTHTIRIQFEESPLRLFSNIISLGTFLLMCGLLLYNRTSSQHI